MPAYSYDLIVQVTADLRVAGATTKGKAEKGFVVVRVLPTINSNQGRGVKFPSRFFHRFTFGGFKQRLATLPVSGGLIEYHLAFNLFLHQQVFLLAFDNRRHR